MFSPCGKKRFDLLRHVTGSQDDFEDALGFKVLEKQLEKRNASNGRHRLWSIAQDRTESSPRARRRAQKPGFVGLDQQRERRP